MAPASLQANVSVLSAECLARGVAMWYNRGRALKLGALSFVLTVEARTALRGLGVPQGHQLEGRHRMNETQEPLEEAIEDVSEAAEETVQRIEDLAEAVPEEAEEVAEEIGDLAAETSEAVVEEAEDTAEDLEDRLEGFVSEAGNFMARNITDDPEADENDKVWSLAAYLSQIIVPIVVPVIMLVIEPNKDRPFQKYHAAQSLGFVVAAFVYEILAGIVFAVLTAITLGCLAAILWILFLLPIIPAIYYAYLAYQGKRFEMPYLTKFMREQGWL
jgi:uncharacterized membrane protein